MEELLDIVKRFPTDASALNEFLVKKQRAELSKDDIERLIETEPSLLAFFRTVDDQVVAEAIEKNGNVIYYFPKFWNYTNLCEACSVPGLFIDGVEFVMKDGKPSQECHVFDMFDHIPAEMIYESSLVQNNKLRQTAKHVPTIVLEAVRNGYSLKSNCVQDLAIAYAAVRRDPSELEYVKDEFKEKLAILSTQPCIDEQLNAAARLSFDINAYRNYKYRYMNRELTPEQIELLVETEPFTMTFHPITCRDLIKRAIAKNGCCLYHILPQFVPEFWTIETISKACHVPGIGAYLEIDPQVRRRVINGIKLTEDEVKPDRTVGIYNFFEHMLVYNPKTGKKVRAIEIPELLLIAIKAGCNPKFVGIKYPVGIYKN